MTSSHEPSMALSPIENLFADGVPRLLGDFSDSNGASKDPGDRNGGDVKGL
jgi:hypothetical protein